MPKKWVFAQVLSGQHLSSTAEMRAGGVNPETGVSRELDEEMSSKDRNKVDRTVTFTSDIARANGARCWHVSTYGLLRPFASDGLDPETKVSRDVEG